MTPLEPLIEDEIRRQGPITFHRFMEVALYHPDYGYYRRKKSPFGAAGDYYTAEQLQPVFGILIAARIRELFHQMRAPPEFTVVELGAGRGELGRDLVHPYIPVDWTAGALPARFSGVVFSNEFFDALPVHVVTVMDGVIRELVVDYRGGRFVWAPGDRVNEEIESYLRNHFPPLPEGATAEVNLDALRWIERIAESLEAGYVFTIDYGYTRRESTRFPRGSLMSYRRHRALEDVLADPGEQDITAHVCFTALQEHGALHGLETLRFETLSQTLLAAGAADQFHAALSAGAPEEERRRRAQLKNLLFGMGETFRVLLQRKITK